MHKTMILPVAALIIIAACCPALASDIVIAKSDLDHFVGTYDTKQNTFTDYTIAEWDPDDPMAYHNAITQFPDTKGVYFGLAPWYAGLAQAVLSFPEKNLTFVSFVDLKLSYSAQAIVTKWKNVGDSLAFICVTENFPDLGGAPNLDGCYVLPDSSYFMIARSAGGDMESLWHRFIFLVEQSDCRWLEIYRLESNHLMFEPEYTERRCRLIDSLAPVYYLSVVDRHFKASGDKKSDGSYDHEQVSNDTATVNLWDKVQKARTAPKP